MRKLLGIILNDSYRQEIIKEATTRMMQKLRTGHKLKKLSCKNAEPGKLFASYHFFFRPISNIHEDLTSSGFKGSFTLFHVSCSNYLIHSYILL